MKEHQKNCTEVAFNFLTQYEEDGSDLLEQIITDDESWICFYELDRKSAYMIWKKSMEKYRENLRISAPLGR